MVKNSVAYKSRQNYAVFRCIALVYLTKVTVPFSALSMNLLIFIWIL